MAVLGLFNPQNRTEQLHDRLSFVYFMKRRPGATSQASDD